MAVELARNGEMFDYIAAQGGRFSESTARYFFKQLVEALIHCSTKGVVHRDLKPENLLFDTKFDVKIADFGAAEVLECVNGDTKLYKPYGTESYMAPEIFKKEGYSG